MSLWWIFGFFLAERGVELALARRNRRIVFGRGGKELHPESYPPLAALHFLFFASLIAESHPWRIPLDPLTVFCLGGIALTQGLRYWCVATLGVFWNTRIIVLPGASAVRRGPYRFFRHSNYFAVVLELALLPLLARAPVTLFLFSFLNLLILRRRIALEEEALRVYTDYERKLNNF